MNIGMNAINIYALFVYIVLQNFRDFVFLYITISQCFISLLLKYLRHSRWIFKVFFKQDGEWLIFSG